MSHYNKNFVSDWFADQFTTLHPLLQKLHIDGGKLYGNVDINYGYGLAGLIGRHIAKKLHIPDEGVHRLQVNISHQANGLHWDRLFDDHLEMKSLFSPVGIKGDGYWIEEIGALHIFLTVDTRDGGWAWHCIGFKYKGISLPTWLLPRTIAYKNIENGQYRFYVGLHLPVLGKLLSYTGLLSA